MSVTYPLWHLKTLEQAAGARSAYEAARSIVQRHGFRGLYRGGLFGIAGLLPASTAHICAYECSKYHLGSCLPHSVAPALAAAFGECSYVALATPVEVVTVRAQCAGHLALTSAGGQLAAPRICARADLRELWQSGGLPRLYRGGTLTLASSLPESVAWWLMYENSKTMLRRAECSSVAMCSCSAILASATSTLLVNPVDVLKTRAQAGKANWWRGCGVESREPLWRFCLRGLAPRLASAAVASLFESATYEAVMHYGKVS